MVCNLKLLYKIKNTPNNISLCGGKIMSEVLYDIEIVQSENTYIGKMKSNVRPQKPIREYKSPAFEELLEQLIRDIVDENED